MESLWLSGRASERRIRRSEVGFLVGTQNFFIFFHLGPMLVTRRKTSFFISLPSSKLTISLISIYKHNAIDIADPIAVSYSSMLDTCHTNFVIDLAHRGVSVARCRASEHRIQSLRFDSLWGLRIFSFFFFICPTLVSRWKTSSFISLPSSKLIVSLISIYKHYAIDIADPSSMLDACHMNFVIDLPHPRVSVARW